MPVAYLSPSLLQDLTNVSVSPGAGNTGYPLVWNNATGRFELAVLGVAGGGTGTSNGSITGTGALTFTAGGTNQSITLNASGTESSPLGPGNIFTNRPLNVVSPTNAKLVLADSNAPNGVQVGIFMDAPNANSDGYYIFNDSSGFNFFDNTRFKTCFIIAKNGNVGFGEYYSGLGSPTANFEIANSAGNTRLIQANDSTFSINQSTESTSTTTGALQCAGGLGVVKNANIGGNLRFAGGTVPATATSAGTTGDIRYDGSHLYICTATNTWVRTALSTW